MYPFHEGLDYGGRHNVYSRVNGTVVWAPASSYPGYGYYMIIQDANNPNILITI